MKLAGMRNLEYLFVGGQHISYSVSERLRRTPKQMGQMSESSGKGAGKTLTEDDWE